MINNIIKNIEIALSHRKALIGTERPDAFRLFNGFSEGYPSLVSDVYKETLLIYNFDKNPESIKELISEIQAFYLQKLPWLKAVVIKTRNGETHELKRGLLAYGEKANTQVVENQVRYAIDLQLNQDASFYLDTRNLRYWINQNAKDKVILNAFAYTGSLGVAALAGGASRVIQTDLNQRFMGIAKRSYKSNGFKVNNNDFMVGDFFSCVKQLKISRKLFDCIILDPPFFSSTKKGTVDLAKNNKQLINKVRPLINDGGHLIVINNALFFSGENFMKSIQALCNDNYLSVEELISVPQDVTGYPHEEARALPTETKPFNHSTKIVVLKIKRK